MRQAPWRGTTQLWSDALPRRPDPGPRLLHASQFNQRSRPLCGAAPGRLVDSSPSSDPVSFSAIPSVRRYASTAAQSSQRLVVEESDRHGATAPLSGDWADLLADPVILKEQATFSDQLGVPRLIDRPELANVVAIWSRFVLYNHEHNQPGEIRLLWREIYTRRNLHQVDSLEARQLWAILLDTALQSTDPAMLREVWEYAQWMQASQGSPWPGLYDTMMTHFLSQASSSVTIEWHKRLCTSYRPDPWSFVKLLKQHIGDDRESTQRSLMAMYELLPYRNTCDALMPCLQSLSDADIKQSWLNLLARHGDRPAFGVKSRSTRTIPRSSKRQPLVSEARGVQQSAAPEQEQEQVSKSSRGYNLSVQLNLALGQVFGIREKVYNDQLGARWFATSFVGLDFAIQAVHTMGVTEIGPLSVQSIARREVSCDKLLERLKQLEDLGIGVQQTVYMQALSSVAEKHDQDLLEALLNSDVHPDVYEDESIVSAMTEECLGKGDWHMHWLLLSVISAAGQYSAVTTANAELHRLVRRASVDPLLAALEDQMARSIPISADSSHAIYEFILRVCARRFQDENITWKEAKDGIHGFVKLAQRLATCGFPPPTSVWQSLLYHLKDQRHFDALERLALEITRSYSTARTSNGQPTIVHESDVPKSLWTSSPHPHFQVFPGGLPAGHVLHPLRQIFDAGLLGAIVVSACRNALTRGNRRSGPLTDKPQSPSDYFIARGVRLLAMLRDHGVEVPESLVRNAILVSLAELYGDIPFEKQVWNRRKWNHLELREAKALFDQAWGREASPNHKELLRMNRVLGESAWDLLGKWRAEMQTQLGPPENRRE